jgi:hypothetical protein
MPLPARPAGEPDPVGVTGILHQQIAMAGMRGWWLVSADAQVATLGSGVGLAAKRLIIRVDDAGQVSYEEFFVQPHKGLPQWLIAVLVLGGFALLFVMLLVSSLSR